MQQKALIIIVSLVAVATCYSMTQEHQVLDTVPNTILETVAVTSNMPLIKDLITIQTIIFGWTPLHYAARNGDSATVQLLLEAGADSNARDNYGSTPLHRAAERGHIATIELLLKAGAFIHAQDNNGMTALHLAAGWGQIEVVKYLLKVGADKSLVSKNGLTALSIASTYGYISIADVLR